MSETMPGSTTGGTPGILLNHHLKQLKLPTVLREYDKVAHVCPSACLSSTFCVPEPQACSAQGGIDHPRYLLRLVELELIDRSGGGWSSAGFGRRGSRR